MTSLIYFYQDEKQGFAVCLLQILIHYQKIPLQDLFWITHSTRYILVGCIIQKRMAEHLPVVPLLIPEGQCPFRSLGVVTSNKPDQRGELTAANTAPFNFRLALNFRNSSTVSGKCDLEAKRSRSEIQGCRKASSTVIRSIGSIRSICRTKSLA